MFFGLWNDNKNVKKPEDSDSSSSSDEEKPMQKNLMEEVTEELEKVPEEDEEVEKNTPIIEVNEEDDVSGETFMADKKVHGGLVSLLQDKYGGAIKGGSSNGNTEYTIFREISAGMERANEKHMGLEKHIKETLENISALREFINQGYDKVVEIGKQCEDEGIDNQLDSVQQIHKMVLEELDNQLSVLNNILKITVEPTSKDLSELIMKHKDYMKIMDLLTDYEYGTKEASDRLALAYSGITQTGMMKKKVEEALKKIGLTAKEYKSTNNLVQLRKELYNILKKLPVGKLEDTKINDIFEAMDTLEDYHNYRELLDSKKTTFGGMMKKEAKKHGEKYKKGGVPSRKGKKAQKSLKSRLEMNQKTQNEIIKSFIQEVNIRFNSMKDSIDSIAPKIGSDVPYDEKMKEFINAFSQLQELNRENLYFALIELDETNTTQKQMKSRFLDELDMIIKSLDDLIKEKYGSYFNNIKQNLVMVLEVIDTYTSLMKGIKITPKSGGKDNSCMSKTYLKTYQDLTSNSINLISGIANKLEFYGKIAVVRENLSCVSKELSSYSENYTKLLAEAIGEERTRIKEDFAKAKEELESSSADTSDTLIALTYDKEAREGLYKTIEAIDLYLMNFSDAIAKNPQAVSELEKMLQSTQIIAQWFVSKSGDQFKELLESTYSSNDELYKSTKKAVEGISVLKNILSMFIHIGEKFGSIKLQDKIHMSPNTIYKNLVKYVWVSAVNKSEKKLKTIATTMDNTTDDGYFVMCIRAIVAKILTVIGTYSIFKKPEKPTNMITNPVRLILGGNTETPEIIDDAIELYIRLPLLVEFYKNIFDDGNEDFKQNKSQNDDTEIIAFIPEMGSLWSGLIKVIFDKSKYISKSGIYDMQNMKDIIREINGIYKYYANKDKNMIVRNAFCGLISEINRRYGILKKCNVNEYYQLNKRYNTTYLDNPAELSTNFDILNSLDERDIAGPSSLYTRDPLEPVKKVSKDIKTNDLELITELRNKIDKALDMQKLEEVAPYSFNDRLRFYKEELHRQSSNESKFNLVAKAIEQSTDTSRSNNEAYILFHELVVAPSNVLQSLFKMCTVFTAQIEKQLDDENLPESQKIINLLEILYIFTGDSDGLISLKFITNSKISLMYENLTNLVSNLIDNTKYMISKFRNIINPSIIEQFENPQSEGSIYYMEDIFLNHILKNSVASSETNEMKLAVYNEFSTLESFTEPLDQLLKDVELNDTDVFKAILWNPRMGESDEIIGIQTPNQPMADAFKKYLYKERRWENIGIYKIGKMFNLDGVYNDEKGIVAMFNHLLYNYLHEFYDNSTKKIYTKLFMTTAEQTFSSVVYGKGINDITTGSEDSTRKATPENNVVLCASVAYTMKQLLSRSLNPQLNDKYHAISELRAVAPHMVENYRAKLPIFIKLFKFLVDKCMMYKRLLESSTLDSDNVVIPEYVPNNIITATDSEGNPIDIRLGYKSGTISKQDRLSDYKQLLNNVIDGATSIVKDAQSVLDEVVSMDGKSGLFFELKLDFIKDYYMMTKSLPFMPASSMLYALQDPEVMYPNRQLNTPSFKFLYGTRSILNGEKQGLTQMPYMQELLNTYNNSMRVANQFDKKNVEKLMEQLTMSMRCSVDIMSYKDLLSFETIDNDYITGQKVFSLYNNIDQVIDLTQNTFPESNSLKLFNYVYKFSSEVEGTGVMENKTREHARLLNIIDMNVVPINVHALMKEIPLANMYNYSISYGHILDKELPSGGASGVFKELLKNPYVSVDITQPLVKTVLTGNMPELHLFKPRFLSDQLWEKCDLENNPELFDTKVVRDTTWFINIQRMLRRQIRLELSEIKTKVIENNKITSKQLTDYAGEHTEQNNDEFEFVY